MSDSAIFKAAVKLSPNQRAAYLDRACGANEALRHEVESLLRANEAQDSFLEKPASARATAAYAPVTERPGTVIGGYKLMEQIGEGGMGLVFVAEQQQPVRRRVALKIIKPGMDSQQVIARFEAERQALAMMDHVNIARVYEAGTTDSGRPYFVMELVHGVPITEYCDAGKLTPRQRLELFVPVCQAIQHAHQKGIIHRDIKPSNILVTMYDDKPVPKVIDFGVAKAVEQRLTEKTVYTQFGMLVGTFEYMSPEQAEMNAFGVDTRSDIYSLGVLLYELLTGSTPLERQRLREAGYGEIVRLIKEEEPQRPSVRLSTSGTLAKVAAARQMDPAKLSRLVRGELDWVVMRCLEKDRTRRYETANGLARDVERYLKDEPVEACPPSAGYRLRKLTRKYKKPLTAAAGFALLLLAGAAISAWQAVRATLAEKDANAQRNAALTSEEKARENERTALENARVADESTAKAKAAQAELRRGLYLSNASLIQTAWDANNTVRVLELLEAARPRADEEDLRGFEWYYWRRQCHADLGTVRLFYPHGPATPQNLVFSPDARFVAGRVSVSGIKVWETTTGRPIADFPGAIYNVLPAFSPDSKRLATWVVAAPEPAEEPKVAIKVYDVSTGKELFALQNSQGLARRPPFEFSRYPMGQFGLSFSSDGKRIAAQPMVKTGEKGMHVMVWDADDGRELFSVEPPTIEKGVTGLTWAVESPIFSPDGSELAAPAFSIRTVGVRGTTQDSCVRILDASTEKERLQIPTPTAAQCLAYHPDSKRLAASLRVAATTGEEEPQPLSVAVWETATGKQLLRIPAVNGLLVCGLVFSPDGKLLAGWNREEPIVYLWDADSGKLLPGIKGHTSLIVDVVFSADSRRLHVAQQDGAVKVWDVAKPVSLVAPAGGMASRDGFTLVQATGYAHDGLRLAVEESKRKVEPSVVQVLGPDGREIRRLTLPGMVGLAMGAVAFSPDGTRLATASVTLHQLKKPDDKASGQPILVKTFPSPATVQVWDLNTGRELWSVTTIQASPARIAWQGNRIAVTASKAEGEKKGGHLLVLDATTGKEVARMRCPEQTGALALSPDGARLAAYFDVLTSGRVMVWDVSSGALLQTFSDIPATSRLAKLSFSPDGKRLAHAHNPQRTLDAQPAPVTVWDVNTGEKLLTVQGQADSIHSLCFSPDAEGKRLVSAGTREKVSVEVKVWDLVTGRAVLTLSPDRGLGEVQFSPDGQRLLGIRRDKAGFWLETWDAAPLTPEAEGRALAFALAEELPLKSEVIERLRTDRNVGEVVRRAALEQAETFLHDDAFRLNTESWIIVSRAGRKPEDYLRALRWAERAVALAPQNGVIVNTLGAAQYRNGKYEDALATLTRSDEMSKHRDDSDAVFLALTHHRLGNADKAREYLERLRKSARQDKQDLVAEVEALLDPSGP